MLYVLASFVAVVAGILLKGLLHLSLGEIIISLAVPVMLLYKLFGNRPSFFVSAGMIAGFFGGFAAFWAYVIVPIQYYYQIWGWLGIVGGIIAVLLLPAQLIMFLVAAFLKGGAAVYLGNFFAGLCFGLAGLLLFNSALSMSIWSYSLRKKQDEAVYVSEEKHMCRLGILAYGSMIEEPGKEIEPIIQKRISGVVTPFCIEFARSSSTRDGAPTVIPVESGGARVRATIFVLEESTPIETAQDLLWRRETSNMSTNKHYKKPASPNPNSIVKQLAHFGGVETVLYTKLDANIADLTPENLAELAIKSAKGNAGKKNKDGISYLLSLKSQGIITPLMPAYEEAILKKTNTRSLEDALAKLRKEREVKPKKGYGSRSHI